MEASIMQLEFVHLLVCVAVIWVNVLVQAMIFYTVFFFIYFLEGKMHIN